MAGPIRISILANGRQARNEAALTARAYSGLGRTLKAGAAAAGLTVLAAKAIGFTKASIDLEARYSTTMRTIQASSGASARAMERLNAQAIKLGQDTAFSANDAADAMLELSKAGISAKDILGGGVAGTLQLAAAGGTELGTAATIASNAMNAFSLSGKNMDSIAAALAGGANASTASVESLGQALSQVGPGAVNAGLDLQQTVAALSAFDAAGVKGSDAGTSLKTMLDRLVPATAAADMKMQELGISFVKADGSFKSITKVAQILQDRIGGLSAEQRTYALRTLFGSDATRAATILMRQGADGIRKFIKATRDQGAAQKMAEARMGGTAGALERLSGSVETAQLRLGQELAPTVQKVADSLGDNMVPAMEGAIDAGKTFVHAVEPAAKVLKELGEVAVDAVKFVDGLPGPVKEIGIQAGIAALVLPRLAGAVTTVTTTVGTNIARLQQWRAELAYSATRADATSAAMTRLGGAAKAAAGIGGMVALAQGAQNAGTKLGVLETAAGGALLGFSVAGPWGAAIGAGAGALYGLSQATESTAMSMAEAKGDAVDYAGSLDRITGAATKATRATIAQDLQQRGVLDSAGKVGVSTRDLVSAIMGQKAAQERVNGTVRAASQYLRQMGREGKLTDGMYRRLAPAIGQVKSFTQAMNSDLRKAQRETREAGQATQTWREALKGVPKHVRTEVRQLGAGASMKQAKALAREYKLTPKQVRTVIRALGVDRVRSDAKGAKRSLEDVGKAKPGTQAWLRSLTSDVNRGKQVGAGGSRAIAKNLHDGTSKAKADLGPFQRSLSAGIGTARGTASSGGSSVGSALKSGVLAGFSGTQSALVGAAVGAVQAAVAAAKRAGKIHSPSRVMRDEVGKPLGDGLVVGMHARQGAARNAGKNLIGQVLKGVDDGSEGIGKVLDRLTALIEKKLDGKKQADRRKALLKSLKDEYDRLRRIGKEQDAIAKRLKRAQEFAATIKTSVVDYGNVVGLGTLGGGTAVTLPALLSQLTARADAADDYRTLIDKLAGLHLNKTTLKQLLDAGVEGGSATAAAIAAGGASAVKQINELTQRLGQSGAGLGDTMATHFFGAGTRAADGLIAGLKKKQRDLDKVAERLANSLVKRVKKALGIKSPSRVFKSIGIYTADGLTAGIKARDTYVQRSAAGMAASLQRGFGTPTLDASMTAPGSSAIAGGVTYNITVEVPPNANLVEIGRATVKAIDAYENAGGRRKART